MNTPGFGSAPDSDYPGSGSGKAGPSPVTIPDHQLVRCIGRGSYGEVWLARNSIGTYRAVKVLRRQSFADPRPFERELSGIRAFEPISRSHEGLVDILQVGINEEQGYFYYIMELGDDQELLQVCPESYVPRTLARDLSRRGKLPVSECLQLGLSLSDALAHLHRHGLVHRDVKPSNIIFIGGVPKLADIGLVSAVDHAQSYVGTEGYIPPEGPGTPQADIFSLGKLLYEACTGKDRQEFPDLPPGFDQADAGREFLEINEVILHACQHDVRQRYRSAVQLHADLLVLVEGRSVRRLHLLERRFTQLKRAALIVLSAAALAALLLYPLYDHWQEVAANRQRQTGANIAYGTRAVESGDLTGALPYFAEALRLDQGNAAHEAEHRLRLGAALGQCPKLIQMWFATQQVDEVEFSRDGAKVLVVESFGHAQVFKADSGQAVSPPFGQPTFLWRGSLSPEADRAVLGGEDHTARVWRVADGEEILRLEHPDKVFSARFSPDGRHIVTGCRDKLGRVWDAQTGRFEFYLRGNTDALLFAAFSPDGREIVTTGKDFTARLFDATDGHSLGPPLRHSSWVYFAGFGPNSELVTAGYDHHAHLWNLKTFEEIPPSLPHPAGVKSAEFSPDGRLILTACLDGVVRIWDRKTHLPWETVPMLRNSSRVTNARFSPEGERVVASGIDGTVRIWDLAGAVLAPVPFRGEFSGNKSRYVTGDGRGFQVRDTFSRHLISLVLTPPRDAEHALLSYEGRFLLMGSALKSGDTNEPNVQVWDCEDGGFLGPGLRLEDPVRAFAVSPGTGALVLEGAQVVQARSIPQGALLWRRHLEEPLVGGPVLNPERTMLAVWTSREALVFDVATGRQRFALPHASPIKDVEFSPNGQWLVTCDADNGYTPCRAQVWDARSGKTVGSPLLHDDGVVCATFSPDSSRVLTCSEDFTARLWDTATGQAVGAPMQHRDQVLSAAFSPNGRWIVTGAADGSARVWSAESGDPLTPPFHHPAALAAVRFLAAGQAIFTLDDRGDARVFNLAFDKRAPEDLLAISRLLSGDMITPFRSDRTAKESLVATWERLRTRYSLTFSAPPGHIAAWDEEQAQESEREQEWSAAVYHLRRLVSLRPSDESLKQRLERAQQRLKKEKQMPRVAQGGRQ